jgi:hypothetical protein
MDIEYYVKKLKEHEEKQLSTNERNNFWRDYNERRNNNKQ